MIYYTHIFRTPVGDLYTAVNERGAVARLLFASEGRMAALESGLEGTIVRDAARCRHVVDQIEEYFSGERRASSAEERYRAAERITPMEAINRETSRWGIIVTNVRLQPSQSPRAWLESA